MKIGYIRVSKSDGSQVLDLQRDALLEAGVEAARIYSDLGFGRTDDRPGLAACLQSLQPGHGTGGVLALGITAWGAKDR